jgi:hypothetical protein
MEPVLVTLVKHPLVWGGLGLLVRYEGRSGADYGLSAATWRAVGAVSFGVGLMHIYATRTRG